MALLRIKQVTPLPGHRLRLTLTDGTIIERDVSGLLRGPVFQAIRDDPEVFAQARAERGTVVWPGEIDLCPDVLIWDGPPPEPPSRTAGGRRTKVAKLIEAEGEPGTVRLLVKLHDGRGRAIYLYDLINNEMTHVRKPGREEWEYYSRTGIQVPHPNALRATDVRAWVDYARQEAARHGLTVGEGSPAPVTRKTQTDP
jgi:hypothetical protein